MHFYTVDKDKFVYGDTKAKRKFPHVFRMDGRGAVHSSKFKLVRTSPFGHCTYIVLSAHITQVHTVSYPDCQMYQRQRYGVVEICAWAFVIGFSKLATKVLGCESGVLEIWTLSEFKFQPSKIKFVAFETFEFSESA